MSFANTLRKEIEIWWYSDEPFTQFTNRIREKYPVKFKEWIETNPLPEERRKALDKMFLSLLSLTYPIRKSGGTEA